MPNQSGRIILVLAFFILVAVTFGYLLVSNVKENEDAEQVTNISSDTSMVNNNINPTELTKKYLSADFKMKIDIPSGLLIEDKFPLFVLKGELGEIQVVRNGTNFDDLDDYLEDFDSKRKLNLYESNPSIVNGYPVVIRNSSTKDSEVKQKSAFLFAENYVYIFSTFDEALYPAIDQIVQSFEYNP